MYIQSGLVSHLFVLWSSFEHQSFHAFFSAIDTSLCMSGKSFESQLLNLFRNDPNPACLSILYLSQLWP